ncbi:MAG: hypothetical protein M9955_17055 [Rhizobiaceae bacterium]|nr:hypothetical protein [Rhizobiaceae bacterium]
MAAVFTAFANAMADELDDARKQINSIEAAISYLEDDAHRWPEVPDGFAFSYGSCEDDDSQCHYSQATLAIELPFAYKGNYQAQRNVSYCLWDGCQGAIQPAKTLGCAWRIVIAASGSAKVDDTDLMNLRSCAGQLDPAEFAIARAQAGQLFRVVYDRDLPAEWQ